MSYTAQKYLAIATAVILAGLGVLQVANPADFGLSPVAARWLGVIVAMLGVLQGFLPSVRGMASDPDFLIHRIEELPSDERQKIVTALADHAASEGRG